MFWLCPSGLRKLGPQFPHLYNGIIDSCCSDWNSRLKDSETTRPILSHSCYL